MTRNAPWIAIDGCIGTGKTTLALLLSEGLGIDVELERSSKHPFLADFYAAPEATAIQTELVFVLIHYHQISSVIAHRNRPLVTDFTLAKDLLFARMNLAADDLSLFLTVYNYVAMKAEAPGLLVQLEASDDLLWHRVKLRDRPFERNMRRDYLERINAQYNHLEEVCRAAKLLRLRSDEVDIVNSNEDRRQIVDLVAREAGL
jgi:deoxyguanosine kinase